MLPLWQPEPQPLQPHARVAQIHAPRSHVALTFASCSSVPSAVFSSLCPNPRIYSVKASMAAPSATSRVPLLRSGVPGYLSRKRERRGDLGRVEREDTKPMSIERPTNPAPRVVVDVFRTFGSRLPSNEDGEREINERSITFVGTLFLIPFYTSPLL